MKRRKDHLVRAAALLSAISFSACGSDRPDGGLPREANGRVLNTAPQWRSGEEWLVSDEPVLVIGGAQSEGADDLFGVAGAVRLSDGRIAIADRGSSGIRLYSSGGSHVRTSGGKGSGPGEFRGVDGIARIRGDTILVWDRSAGRMSVFDPAGTDGVEAMRVARDKPRVRATRADVERYREFLASRNLGSVPPEVRAGAEQRVAAIPHREMLPSFGELRVDEAGHVWVAQFGLPGQPQKWDVFDPAGVWLGTVGMPGDLVIHEIGMDYVLGVATDELGVERVGLYRLQRT